MQKRPRDPLEDDAVEETEIRVKRLALGSRAPSPAVLGADPGAGVDGSDTSPKERDDASSANVAPNATNMTRDYTESLAQIETELMYRYQAEQLRLLHFERLVRARTMGENTSAETAPSDRLPLPSSKTSWHWR
jgi:hypothetical protein